MPADRARARGATEGERHFAASRGAEVIARLTEVEGGRVADLPELAEPLHLVKVTGAMLLVAKLGRPSRNAAFLLSAD